MSFQDPRFQITSDLIQHDLGEQWKKTPFITENEIIKIVVTRLLELESQLKPSPIGSQP
jgi:hypothetical protein